MTKMSEPLLLQPRKRPEFKGGTWIAQFLHRMLVLTSSLALTGCLAFDKVELPEIPDYPPSVVDDVRTPYPSSGIIELDFSDNNTDSLVLMVVLRDANLSQPLTYRVFVDGTASESNMRVWETAEATGEYDRPVTVSVPSVPYLRPGDTGGSCHRVELIVTGAFADTGVDQRIPRRTNDFASLVWWVRSSGSVVTPIDLTTCPAMLVPVQRDPT